MSLLGRFFDRLFAPPRTAESVGEELIRGLEDGSIVLGRGEEAEVPDPDLPLVPTEAHLECLPRWARAAFAARCARRAAPLDGYPEPDAYRQAVELVERAAAEAGAGGIADEAGRLEDPFRGYAVGTAARAVAEAAAGRNDAHLAGLTASGCVQLLAPRATVGTVWAVETVARDFTRLLRRAREEKWTDSTPVPPNVFGPLWDGDPPEWWQEADLVKTSRSLRVEERRLE